MVLQVLPEGKPTRLTLDASDPRKEVGVEFVSREKNERMAFLGALIRNYDPRGVAEFVDATVQKNGHDLYFGVFYDPASNSLSSRRTRAIERKVQGLQRQREFGAEDAKKKELAEALHARSRRLLRMQVHDFINWLKGQGVI